MSIGPADDDPDLADQAAAARTVADLAQVLRALRRREARRRHGRELTYDQIAERTGWSATGTGDYLTGARLASVERFDELVRFLGASPYEQGVLATARDRVVEGRRSAVAEASIDAGHPPRMLPPTVSGFTGRAWQISFLEELLVSGTEPGAVVICAVAGMAGVGKTALAVHWAHSVADSFPAGQLYVNLRGYDPSEPLSTMDALGSLLGGLGVVPDTMPRDINGRVALYRRLLGQHRMLVLLDNGSGLDQIRPLLPPPSSLALVTSRDDLSDLTTVDGARRFTLDVLTENEAEELLRALIGPRADEGPDVLPELARLCGYLPLALRVAAEHVAFRPGVSLPALAEELRATGLEALETTGDERADVRAVFSWSLRRLPAPAVRAFRLLGAVPGHDIDTFALAALVDADLSDVGPIVDALVQAQLVKLDDENRLSMHDLLRTYAIDSASRDLDPTEVRAATDRLLDYYVSTATAAVDTQYPYGRRRRRQRNARAIAWEGAAPDVLTVPSAAQWLSTERDNVVRACLHAARNGWPGHAIALAAVLRPFFDNGHDLDGLTVHNAALEAATLMGADCEPIELAYIYICLAITNWRLSLAEVAAVQAQQALAEYARLDNSDGMTMSLVILGAVRDRQGRYAEAVDCYQRGLRIARTVGNRVHEASQLHNLGWILLHMEQYETAADMCRQALEVYQEIDQVPGIAETHHGLAAAYAELGRFDEALGLAEVALAVELEYGHTTKAIEISATIGTVYRMQGRLSDAIEQNVQALAAARDVGQPALTALVLNVLGTTYHDAVDHRRAKECHAEAVQLTEEGDRLEYARALLGLGNAYAGLGDTTQAEQFWRRALDAHVEMDLPSAENIRALLASASA